MSLVKQNGQKRRTLGYFGKINSPIALENRIQNSGLRGKSIKNHLWPNGQGP